MAKSPKSNVPQPSNQPVKDLSVFYSDLAFVPQSVKESKVWMAQSIFNAKMNNLPLIDAVRARNYRALSRMEINRQEYVEMVDPKTPEGNGGTAAYFAADFKSYPGDIHLDNIVRAKMEKIVESNRIQVNEIDKFAKSQRQVDKDKVIYQREFRKLINECNTAIGLPPIKESEDPSEYVKSLSGEATGEKVDKISKLIDSIKSKVVEKKDWELYDRYVYKGDIERAFELGVQHYMFDQNKWRIQNEFVVDDIKLFNVAAARAYVDETSGRLIPEYLPGEIVFTSPFQNKDGSDMTSFFFEKYISFAEFVRQFGTTLTNEQLKTVLEQNKINASVFNFNFRAVANNNIANNSMIKVGYFSVLTQEAENYAQEVMAGNVELAERKPLTWAPDKETATQKQKIYNVWYSCYYIPPPTQTVANNNQASWDWQSQFIFNMKKDMDQYRYGPDLRYARSQLVIWKDYSRPSFMDIKEGFMPKIRNAWHKFQNALVQDTSAVAIDADLITGLLSAVDESNAKNMNDPKKPSGGNGVNAGMEAWRSIKQGGMGFVKFRDKNGNLVVQDPSRLFVNIDNKQLEKAEKYLQIILLLYQNMTVALAQSDVTEGQTPKPRTAVAGIEASLEAANNGVWFIEKPIREFTIMMAERYVQHILYMVKDKKQYDYARRWDEFCDVIGLANALMVEGIEDISPEDIGITVSLEDTAAMREYIFNLANQMANQREVSREAVGLVIDTLHNMSWKYAYALLMLGANEQKRENMAQAEVEHQRQMELGMQQLQVAQQLLQVKSQGKQQEIDLQGKLDQQADIALNQSKYQTMTALAEQRKENKIEEEQHKAQLRITEQQAKVIMPV